MRQNSWKAVHRFLKMKKNGTESERILKRHIDREERSCSTLGP